MLLPLLASWMETCMGERDDAACAGMSTDNPPTPASKILMLSLSGRLLAGSSEGMFYFLAGWWVLSLSLKDRFRFRAN